MRKDVSQVIGRAWVITCSCGSDSLISDGKSNYIAFPVHDSSLNDNSKPPLQIDALSLLRIASSSYDYEEVEICRVGQNGFDLIMFFDSGHQAIIDVDDQLAEQLLREQGAELTGLTRRMLE